MKGLKQREPTFVSGFSFMPNGMKCHLGHGYFPCRNCVRSRVFDRFAARTLRALDWARFRQNPGKLFNLPL